MRKRFLKALSLLLVIVIAALNFAAVAASAESLYSVCTLRTESIQNPLYAGVDTEASAGAAITPKTYYSAGEQFDVSLCTADLNVAISQLRAAMVNREASVDIYYKDANQYEDIEEFENLLARWLEQALAETDNAAEGDYLAYVYKSFNGFVVTQYIEGETEYYHKITFSLEYYTTKEQEAQLEEKLNKVIEGFNFTSATTERQKSDTIYNYITGNVAYDYDNLNVESYKLKFTAYAALINGTAVCQGYATLFYRLARECGLEARVITGTSMGDNHAWNIVKIGDRFYYADCTWDAGNRTYSYYLKGSDDFASHLCEEKYLSSQFTEEYPIALQNYDISPLQNQVEGDFQYEVYVNKAKITKYTGNAKKLTVPATLGGYEVREFGYHAIEYNETLETITFSEGIEFMSEEALFSCYKLKKINFPSTMGIVYEKYAEDGVYSGCSGVPNFCDALETVTIADGNTKMQLIDGIVYSADGKDVILCPANYSKATVTLPEGVVTVAPMAFKGCKNIKKVVMPDTVKYIGYWAFHSAYALEEINISNTCEIIGQFAFEQTKITSVHIPASMKTIMSAAFGTGCRLESITVDPENELFRMQDGALLVWDYVNEYDIMLDYEIGNTATSFTVPSSVEVIEQYALAETNLKEIIVPETVKVIFSYAFAGNDNLTHFEIPNSIDYVDSDWLIDCNKLAGITIPSSVTYIDGTFFGSGEKLYTVYGESGSFAESYCQENSIKFKNISEFKCLGGHSIVKNVYDNRYQYVCADCGDVASINYRAYIESVAYSDGVTLSQSVVKYTGSAIKPTIVSLKDGDRVLTENVDYKILGYENNKNVGWGWINIEGLGDYCGTGQILFEITPATDATAKLSYTTVVYNGGQNFPEVVVKNVKGKTLEMLTDYNVEYMGDGINAGTFNVTVTMCGNYDGIKTLTYKVTPKSSGIAAKLSYKECAYTGKTKSPTITVMDGSNKLTKSSYSVKYYTTRKYVGKHKVVVTLKGNYSGSKTLNFTINPAKTTVKKLTPARKALKVSITKKSAQISGYQIQYSTSKKFSGAKAFKITGTSKTIKSLKAKKTYYVRVRTYKKVGTKVYYSDWSAAKKAKTK